MMRYSILVFACVYALVISAFAQMPGGIPDGFYGYNQVGPTPPQGDSSNRLATTEFVRRAISPLTAWTFNVSTTGSDSNDCLTAATACKTIQHTVDLCPVGATCSVTVAAGSYNVCTVPNAGCQALINVYYYRAFSIIGDCTVGHTTDVEINITDNGATGITSQDHSIVGVSCLKMSTNGTGNVGLTSRQFGILDWINITWGNYVGGVHVFVTQASASCAGTETINGGASYHIYSVNLGNLTYSCTVSIPSVTGWTVFGEAQFLAILNGSGATFSGAGYAGSTGTKCDAYANSIVAGGAVFPGNVVCTSSFGGLLL